MWSTRRILRVRRTWSRRLEHCDVNSFFLVGVEFGKLNYTAGRRVGVRILGDALVCYARPLNRPAFSTVLLQHSSPKPIFFFFFVTKGPRGKIRMMYIIYIRLRIKRVRYNNNNNNVWMCTALQIIIFGRRCARKVGSNPRDNNIVMINVRPSSFEYHKDGCYYDPHNARRRVFSNA